MATCKNATRQLRHGSTSLTSQRSSTRRSRPSTGEQTRPNPCPPRRGGEAVRLPRGPRCAEERAGVRTMDAIAAEMAELDAELHGHESGQRALDVSTHGRLVNRRLEAATELARVQQKLAPP